MEAPPQAKRQRRRRYGRISALRRLDLYRDFVTAAEQGDLEMVQQLLEIDQVVTVDCLRYDDRTALQTASCSGCLNVVQYLLQAGANVNWESAEDGITALHAVCEYAASAAVVAALIQAGADIDAENEWGSTPLMLLLYQYSNHNQLPIFRLLLDAGCDVNVENKLGYTPLYHACGYDDNEETVDMLIKAGAVLIDREKYRLLHQCAQHAAVKKLRILLNHPGIDLDSRNELGDTAVHVAVRFQKLDVMQILLQDDDDRFLKNGNLKKTPQEKVYDVNDDITSDAAVYRSVDPEQRTRLIDCQNSKGQTVLHYAVTESPQLLSELLNWKPNLNMKAFLDHDRQCTALELAVRQSAVRDTDATLEMLRCLLEHPNGYGGPEWMCDRVRALHLAIQQEDYDNVTLVIEYLSNRTDLRIQDHLTGNTALHLAAAKKQCTTTENIISILLRNPTATEAVNVRSACGGTTVLQDAIIHGQSSNTVRAIAEMSNVNRPDRRGRTPLHYAVVNAKIQNVRILLHCRADVSMRDQKGNTAFVLACCLAVVFPKKKKKENQLSVIYELFRHGIAYGELPNMV